MNAILYKFFTRSAILLIAGAVLVIYAGVSFADETATSTLETSTSTDPEAEGPSPEDLARELLQRQIEERAKELEKINQELATTQKSLNETQTQRRGLQRELNTLQYTTNQLNLNIKADSISIEKLGLEIQTLTFDIQDIEAAVIDKKAAIGEIFRELQQNGRANFLVIFLKHKSLANSVLEFQALSDLNRRLSVDIASLQVLKEELSVKVEDLNDKKGETSLRRRNLENRRVIVRDQAKERQTLIAETKNKENVYEQQITELRKLQQEIANEIESLDAELRTKIDPSLLPKAQAGVLGIPLDDEMAITQKYGGTAFAQTAYPGKWHNGIDIRAPVGTPILAAEAGVVAGASDQDAYRGCYRGAYGKYVAINHDNNLTTLYAHLSRFIVKEGDIVERGEVIGYAGRTGYATGAHLHFTVFAQPTFYIGPSRVCGPMPYGGDLNPERYL